VAITGILLGALAFWLALPPASVRAPWWPVLVGLLGVAAGIWSVSRGVRRAGWGAVAAGIAGIALGLLAIQASPDHLDQVVVWSALVTGMLVWATPLTFAAMGGLICERSGVVNIGLEGMMLAGAFFGALGADKLGSWVWGMLVAIAAGGAFALLHAVFAVHLRADQVITGTAINFFALGATGYLFIKIYGTEGTPSDLPRIPDLDEHTAVIGPLIHQIGRIPFIGNVLDDLNLMIWLSFLLVVLVYVVMFKTPLGLRIRSVGENPRAAEASGVSVFGARYTATIVSGMLAAAGGAYLSIGFVGSFNQNMTEGRGFIALAAVVFGNWRPFGAFAAALLFGGSTALSFRLAQSWGTASVLFQALPYVLTLIAVAGVIGRSIPPAASGRPYIKQ